MAALPDSRLDHVSTKTRRTMLGVALALYVTGTIGSNVAFGWLDTRPELVLALSSRNRNLLGSVPFINPLAYALIGFSRVMLVAVVLYLVGRWFGPRALGWVENQLGELPSIYRWAQSAIDRVGWVVVVLMPGSNLVCLLAGHRRMDVRRFVTAAAAGTVLKLGRAVDRREDLRRPDPRLLRLHRGLPVVAGRRGIRLHVRPGGVEGAVEGRRHRLLAR